MIGSFVRSLLQWSLMGMDAKMASLHLGGLWKAVFHL